MQAGDTFMKILPLCELCSCSAGTWGTELGIFSSPWAVRLTEQSHPSVEGVCPGCARKASGKATSAAESSNTCPLFGQHRPLTPHNNTIAVQIWRALISYWPWLQPFRPIKSSPCCSVSSCLRAPVWWGLQGGMGATGKTFRGVRHFVLKWMYRYWGKIMIW